MTKLTTLACLTLCLLTSAMLTGCGSHEPVTTTSTTTTRSTSVEPTASGSSTTTVVRRSGY